MRKSVCPDGQSERLLEGHEGAKAKWQALVEGEEEGLVSGLTPVELLRLGLKGALKQEDAELLLKAIPAVCRVVWPDWASGERAARLSLVDALILVTALEAGAGELWTADSDLARYEGRMRVVLLTG